MGQISIFEVKEQTGIKLEKYIILLSFRAAVPVIFARHFKHRT